MKRCSAFLLTGATQHGTAAPAITPKRRASSFGPPRSDRNAMIPLRFCGRTAPIAWKPCCAELYVGPSQHGTPWGVKDVAPPQHSGPEQVPEVITTMALPGKPTERRDSAQYVLHACPTRLRNRSTR